jgi:hypothetical protein
VRNSAQRIYGRRREPADCFAMRSFQSIPLGIPRARLHPTPVCLAVSLMTAELRKIPNRGLLGAAELRGRGPDQVPAITNNENQTVNPLPQPQAAVAERKRRSADAQDGPREQTIVQWSVVGHDRLLGTIFGPLGQGGAPRTVMTSPVVQVRLMGTSGRPVAFTESGSAYRLGEPAELFGQARAEKFVAAKARPPGQPVLHHPEMVSSSIALDD